MRAFLETDLMAIATQISQRGVIFNFRKSTTVEKKEMTSKI